MCYNTTKIRRSQGLKVYKTAKLEILGSHIIEPTIRIYREALSFVIDVCYKEKAGWLTLGGKDRYNFVEKLIHATSDNPNPKYAEFDKKFYKMPSYLRRSIVAEAIGIVISYLSSQDKYDLGITNSAVVSAVMKDGTVIDRLFINQPKEKDHLKYQLDRLNKANRMSGIKNKKPNIWRKINNLLTAIATQTANDIVDFAKKNNAKVIVFEHLHFKKKKDDKKKKLGSKRQYWTKYRIQEIVKNKAHSMGIRFSRVNARNTSALAFDGSGYVRRNTKGDIATFTTGKIYHADLSASYNIAARYFLRELERAKVPVRIDRTSQTLDTLINLAMRPHHPSKVA